MEALRVWSVNSAIQLRSLMSSYFSVTFFRVVNSRYESTYSPTKVCTRTAAESGYDDCEHIVVFPPPITQLVLEHKGFVSVHRVEYGED